MTRPHNWQETGKHGFYIEFTRIVAGRHETFSVYAEWVRCRGCGAKGFRRAPRRVVYTCEDWGHK